MTAPSPTPKPRGRKASGNALSPAERQKLYRERMKAKLAEAATIPLHDDKAESRIDELNRKLADAQTEIARLNKEGDALAYSVDRLQRAVQAGKRKLDERNRQADKLHADLEWLRAHVATWKTEGGTEATAEPVRPKSRRKKA